MTPFVREYNNTIHDRKIDKKEQSVRQIQILNIKTDDKIDQKNDMQRNEKGYGERWTYRYIDRYKTEKIIQVQYNHKGNIEDRRLPTIETCFNCFGTRSSDA